MLFFQLFLPPSLLLHAPHHGMPSRPPICLTETCLVHDCRHSSQKQANLRHSRMTNCYAFARKAPTKVRNSWTHLKTRQLLATHLCWCMYVHTKDIPRETTAISECCSLYAAQQIVYLMESGLLASAGENCCLRISEPLGTELFYIRGTLIAVSLMM